MSLFSSLRSRASPLVTSDEKDHDSDGADEETSDDPQQRTPLLAEASSGSNNVGGGDSFSLRIKLNDGASTVDFPLEGVSPTATVRKLKERILSKHFDSVLASPSSSRTSHANRYLRLIVRGRMMAPDTSSLETFSIAQDDVIHAVLAKEGARGGQQARMLRRMNIGARISGGGNGGNATGGGSAGGSTARSSAERSLWRRIGIDANGVVVSPNNNEDESDEDSEDSDFEDAHGEIDLEIGRRSAADPEGGGRRRRRRERRGFDRLRSTGMTRDEVTAIRLYFRRSVDRYIERRRAMIRASRMLRESLGSIAGGENRARSDTGDSSNSLLDEDEPNDNAEGSGNDTNSDDNNGGEESGANRSENNEESTLADGEEILTDRLRMEDEWMSTQGPYSEFRMNLNTSNPLLLAAITEGGAGAAAMPEMGPAGLLFRRNAAGGAFGGLDPLADEDEDGAFAPGGTFLRNRNNPSAFNPYMGPVPAAGTDKDFVWGFILGFFVGFIMLFWVWMPTVPHKQKVGIISGISFQLGLSLLRKGGQGGSGSVAAI
ncbi:hypothetical protein ACHAXT_012092 [Thalassiosira profunda]